MATRDVTKLAFRLVLIIGVVNQLADMTYDFVRKRAIAPLRKANYHRSSIMMQVCRICANGEANRLHVAREMLFGSRERFTYLECGQCGCVQLLEIPADMTKYYPPDYYSFQEHGKLKTFLRRQWSAHACGNRNPVGALLSALFFPNVAILALRHARVPKEARILDVGCGSGRLLLDLSYLGFKNVTGVDPYIAKDLFYDNGVKVFKRQLSEMPGEFDYITLHHSFEHMDRPAEVMFHLHRLLSPGGTAIVRIPVASSYAWKRYGVNWFNLDAPRHFYIHTFKSIELLAQKVGLKIIEAVQEGGDTQFWASEEYEKDIAHNDRRSLGLNPIKRMLAWKQLRAWQAQAEELNRKQEADQVGFHLRKAA